MDLTDGCGRHRLIRKVGELLYRGTEFGIQDFTNQRRMHRRSVGLQPAHGLLVGPEPAGAQRTGVEHRHDLADLHQYTAGVAEQIGVALGGALVKPFDGPVLTRLLPQSGDEPAARGPGGKPCQRHRAPEASARNRVVLIRHCVLSPSPLREQPIQSSARAQGSPF